MYRCENEVQWETLKSSDDLIAPAIGPQSFALFTWIKNSLSSWFDDDATLTKPTFIFPKKYAAFLYASFWKGISTPYVKTISCLLLFSRFINSAQAHNSSADFIELKHHHEQEMDTQGKFSSEVAHLSVSTQIKLATQSSLRQVEKLCALLV